MNVWPMRRRFSCGSVTPASAARNCSSAFTTCRSVLKCLVNSSMTRLASSLRSRPLSTRMQESCGPIAWYKQRGDDGRIDAAGQAADDAVVADALANLRDRLLGEVAQPPGAGAAADVGEKVGEDRLAFGRVRHFGVELQAVERPRAMLDRGVRAGVGAGERDEIVRDACRPGRRGSSRLAFRRRRRRTGRGLPWRRRSPCSARGRTRGPGDSATRPPRAWHMSCMP